MVGPGPVSISNDMANREAAWRILSMVRYRTSCALVEILIMDLGENVMPRFIYISYSHSD